MVIRRLFAKLLGNRGEKAAAEFLRKAGYKILAQQYRNQFGEIDLIVQQDHVIVFVEVKTRSSTDKGHPTEAITKAKQEQMTKLALVFLKRRRLLDRAARFDVISIVWPEDSEDPQIDHYINAFEPTGRGQMFS